MVWKDDFRNIIVEFLTARLTDPRGRLSNTTDTFNGTGASQTLTLTPSSGKKAMAIVSVTSNAVTKSKWQDYTIDIQNQTVTGTFDSGTGNVVVTYKEGTTTWIYPGDPRCDLTSTSYPRISIDMADEEGVRLGSEINAEDIIYTAIVSAETWVKENYVYDAGTITYEGVELASYLVNQIKNTFRTYMDDIYPELWGYKPITTKKIGFVESHQTNNVTHDFEISGFNLGG